MHTECTLIGYGEIQNFKCTYVLLLARITFLSLSLSLMSIRFKLIPNDHGTHLIETLFNNFLLHSAFTSVVPIKLTFAHTLHIVTMPNIGESCVTIENCAVAVQLLADIQQIISTFLTRTEFRYERIEKVVLRRHLVNIPQQLWRAPSPDTAPLCC